MLYFSVGYQGYSFYGDGARLEKTYAAIVEFYYNNTTAAYGLAGLFVGLLALYKKREKIMRLQKSNPHFFILLFFLVSLFAGNMTASEGATIHGYAQNVLPPVIALMIAYLAFAVLELPRFWKKVFLSVVALEMALFFWLQNALVLAKLGWVRDENRLLKMVNELTFVKDLLGNYYLLFAVIAILIQVAAIMLFLKWSNARVERALQKTSS